MGLSATHTSRNLGQTEVSMRAESCQPCVPVADREPVTISLLLDVPRRPTLRQMFVSPGRRKGRKKMSPAYLIIVFSYFRSSSRPRASSLRHTSASCSSNLSSGCVVTVTVSSVLSGQSLVILIVASLGAGHGSAIRRKCSS